MSQDAYAAAGVDVAAGNEAVTRMKASVQRTYNQNVLSGLGGFGAAFAIGQGYDDPILIAGADGVGTKLLLAIAANKHDTIGQDLVAMTVNDILAQGAKPLFLLDYLAVDKIRPAIAAEIVGGIASACEQVGVALIGGESAELPGLYAPHHYDLAAFGVGIVERQRLLQKSAVEAGDVLIGLASSGIHSNGYSLVRQVFNLHEPNQFNQLSTEDQAELLKPTKLYGPMVQPLIDEQLITSIAHITGGGIVENLPRAYTTNLKAEINWGSWPILPIFNQIQAAGQLRLSDMLLTFNNGLGMVLIVKPDVVKSVLARLTDDAYVIGTIQKRQHDEKHVEFRGEAPWHA
ncbi:phosphoribosylformylglycinamidine cyclo-ligase [Weissella diestrammenae]|uniref:Phosphoribosylformylglycinamidine cyclo-ligase n=2 Tax=Weissella diestrammenae TaxID=1162633 RepID=A0A7G9T7M7_9LACO|nr:phosphoribosylformylglycinamidine cyclo-ligase [Weissella diestrammenae]MCM0583402.1 phosphoribosylformylglycinamidine cyclo-ligase [Weissella diestrammenae]QNN76102.1 phosphoribosylformylglycinamidine cyclo-ligase [Weissella diestrammenae]